VQTNVLTYFEEGALKKCPNKTALIDQGRRYTFSELEIFAKNCAGLILDRFLGVNQPIAVFLPKSAETVISDLGILYTGNCYVNLDIASPPQRLKAILENLGFPLVISTSSDAKVLRSLGISESNILLIELALIPERKYEAARLKIWEEKVLDLDPVYIMFTSGSTGVPKGVVIPHRGVIDYIDWAINCYNITQEEVIGNQAPLFFDNSTLDLYLCFACGATLALIPQNFFGFPGKLIPFLRDERITTIFWVPSVLTNVANLKVLENAELPPLRKILFAGEVMSVKTLNYWRKFFPHALFSNLYGPTEITVDCTYFIVDREFSDDEKLPIGFPCRNTDVLILTESDKPAETGQPGELCVRGSSLALGYWNNSERTEKAFVQNPLNQHYPEKLYRTGDLVSRNERGEIMFIGRKDFQIKHLGYRIELGEIEHALLQVKEIRNCCVLYNDTKREITLIYESDTLINPGQIREQLAAFIPKYMLPTIFHWMERLPLNASGKVDRQQLGLLAG
jgi:D-alanine--poly(phosphoribitol) ligase subunit 1